MDRALAHSIIMTLIPLCQTNERTKSTIAKSMFNISRFPPIVLMLLISYLTDTCKVVVWTRCIGCHWKTMLTVCSMWKLNYTLFTRQGNHKCRRKEIDLKTNNSESRKKLKNPFDTSISFIHLQVQFAIRQLSSRASVIPFLSFSFVWRISTLMYHLKRTKNTEQQAKKPRGAKQYNILANLLTSNWLKKQLNHLGVLQYSRNMWLY